MEKHKTKTVLKIIKDYLNGNNYDGLYNSHGECACELSDLVPCGEDCSRCLPGYKVEPPPSVNVDYDFLICPNKDDKPWRYHIHD